MAALAMDENSGFMFGNKEQQKFKVRPGVMGSPKKVKMKKVRNFRVVTKDNKHV